VRPPRPALLPTDLLAVLALELLRAAAIGEGALQLIQGQDPPDPYVRALTRDGNALAHANPELLPDPLRDHDLAFGPHLRGRLCNTASITVG
jgi:hypothetical protein